MFHHSNLGLFGSDLPCDRQGYVPEEGDSPEDFDHEFCDAEEKQWWYEEEFSNWVAQAVAATKTALEKLHEWQNKSETP